jgi:hypothetical protein
MPDHRGRYRIILVDETAFVFSFLLSQLFFAAHVPNGGVSLGQGRKPLSKLVAENACAGWSGCAAAACCVAGTAGAPNADGSIPPRNNQFWDIGWGMKEPLPLQPWAFELRKKRMDENGKDNPDAHCLPMGLMQLHNHPQPRQIIQTPRSVVILYEGNAGIRQIFTDGRPLPSNDPQPWWYGYSTGRWEGDALVVQTSGFRDGGWLDINGAPLTDAAKWTERFRRVSYGSLEIEITVDDPKAYTKPWTVTIPLLALPDGELIEYACDENEKDLSHLVGK